MRAALLEEFAEPLVIEDIDAPSPDPDGVVIEVEACGVCRSDWHVWQGHWDWLGGLPSEGHVLGHEAAGVVVEVGDEVESVREGDHIAAAYNFSDGTCPHCRRGHSNNCDNRSLMGLSSANNGAFAEEVAVPNADFNVISRPDGVEALDVAALGCRYMVAFHSLTDRATVDAGDWVAVHGCGGVGLSAIQIADTLGGSVVAVDISDDKLDLATELGAVATVNGANTDDVPSEIRDITNGGADISIDALGITETAVNSVRCLDTLGQHAQVGLTTEDEEGFISLPTDEMVTKEIEFYGSSGIPHIEYDEVFSMVERGKLDPIDVVSETISLDELPDTLEKMSNFETMGISVITDF